MQIRLIAHRCGGFRAAHQHADGAGHRVSGGNGGGIQPVDEGFLALRANGDIALGNRQHALAHCGLRVVFNHDGGEGAACGHLGHAACNGCGDGQQERCVICAHADSAVVCVQFAVIAHQCLHNIARCDGVHAAADGCGSSAASVDAGCNARGEEIQICICIHFNAFRSNDIHIFADGCNRLIGERFSGFCAAEIMHRALAFIDIARHIHADAHLSGSAQRSADHAHAGIGFGVHIQLAFQGDFAAIAHFCDGIAGGIDHGNAASQASARR